MKLIHFFLLMVFACMFVMPSYAESQCKSLKQTECDVKAVCSWVDGYERKDGKKVNAFCRTQAKGANKTN